MKKLFVILLLGVFLISFTSADEWEWDNGISDYNIEHEVITFSNGCILGMCAGDVIGQVQLKTPKNFKQARGYNYVWELDAWVYEDYNDFLKGFEFEDLANGKVKINREIDIKILSYEDVEVTDYETQCYMDYSNYTNGTQVCNQIVYGSHIEQKEVWKKVTPADLKKADGKVTLRGYTDVQKGDKIDWSPLIFGVRVSHDIWAVWTEDLNVDIISYYKLDESSGVVLDSLNINNGTNNGAARGVTGLLGDSFDFNDGDYVDTDTNAFNFITTDDFSISFWVNPDDWTSSDRLIASRSAGNLGLNFIAQTSGGTGDYVQFWGDAAGDTIVSTEEINVGSWNHIVATHTSGDTRLYVNDATAVTGSALFVSTASNLLFAKDPTGSAVYTGLMDEIGIWNRTLSASEVTQLWNGGSGITYTNIFGISPSVILISPQNNSNLTSSNIDFIATVTDDQQINNATLFINGIANVTNSSGFNGSYTFNVVLPEGLYNWSIIAIDNQSLENQSETRIFNLTIPPIFIDLLSPPDSSTHNTPLVNMSCTAYKDEGVTQLNLTINGITNISIINTSIAENLTISQEINFSEDNYTWGCSAISPSTSAVSSNRTFEVLYSSPVINLFSPDNDSEILIENATFVFNASDVNGIANVSLFINEVLNETNSSGVEGNYSFFRTLTDGFYNWSVTATSTLGKITNSTTRFFTLHTKTPVVNITAPSGLINFFKLGDNETLIYNISEEGESTEHFDECWYVYSQITNAKPNGTIQDLQNYNLSDGAVTSFPTTGTDFITFDRFIQKIITSRSTNNIEISSSSTSIPNCIDETYNSSKNLGDIGQYFCAKNEDNKYFLVRLLNKQIGGGGTVTNITMESYDISPDLNCSANTTNFTYINGANNITVFAIDEFGFTANDTSSWQYLLLEESQTFNTPVTETSRQEFELNITTLSSILSINAILNYNGTMYTAESTCTTGVCNISTAIDIPLIVSGDTQNNTFFWELTGFTAIDSFQVNTSSNEQEVIEAQLGLCDANLTVVVLNFTAFDEQTLLPVDPFDFDGDFEFWTGTGTVILNTSISVNSTSFVEICVKPNGEDFKVNAIIEYDEASGANYTIRNYYFDNDTVNNQTQQIELGLLLATESTSFILAVQDEDILPQPDVLIFTQRFYPGLGIFKTVQVSKTDDNGQTVGFFEVETADYRFILKQGGVTLLTTKQQKVVGTDVPFTLTFTTGEGQDVAWEEFEDPVDLSSSLIYNKTSELVLFTYQDTSEDFESARLIVEKVRYNESTNLELCDISQTQSSGILSCNMSGNETGTYIAKSFIIRDGTTFLDQQIQFQIEDFSSAAGLLGLLLGWFVILVASFMFKFNEIAGIIMVNLAIICTNLFGLIAWGYTFISAMIAVSIIILVVLER